MDTIIHYGEAMPAGKHFVPDGSSARRIAIVHRRLNYRALGTVIERTMRHVGDVYVLFEYPDERMARLVRSLGAKVIDASDGTSSSMIDRILVKHSPCTLIALSGDGSSDPAMIPGLIDQISEGFDLVVGPSAGSAIGVGHMPHPASSSDFIVSSQKCMENFRSGGPGDLTRQMLAHAKNGGLRIKYLRPDEASLRALSQYWIGVVVPAYNEELLIEETLRGIPKYVDRIYVIDDCSKDLTPEIIRRMTDPRIVSLRHEKNMGVGAAIIDGYKLALEGGMDIVAVMAGDNQMDAAELPRLLQPIIGGYADYTKGNRLITKEFTRGMSSWRLFGNWLLTLLTKIASGYWQITDPQNGYTAISRRALEAMDLDSIYTYYGYCNDMLIKLNTYGMKALDVAIPARYGNERSSIKYGKYILKVAPMLFRGFLWRLKTKYAVLNFHPLILFYAAGMILAPLGVLLIALALAQAALRIAILPYAPVIAMLTTLAGIQFLMFAMLFDMQADSGGCKTP